MVFMDEFRYLRICLADIKSATDNFSESNVIGSGGFGKVYKGEVSHYRGRSMVALKRLDRRLGQGNSEFLKEITTLSHYTHENLITLLGYCKEDGENILAYEYACNGSLSDHLNSTTLTWSRRLNICLDAARALRYLHDPMGGHQRVLHRDIKSGNILLDANWIAKLSDLGLSKMAPANQPNTFIISNAAGTPGYCDPLYIEMGFLTKESDVYSFGVLLFEVLTGRLCNERRGNEAKILVPTWKECYEQNRWQDIIFQGLITRHTDLRSMKIFSDIAYQCLMRSRERRPTMAQVERELDKALKTQEISEGKEPQIDCKALSRTVEPSLTNRNKSEPSHGKTGTSINANGQQYEMISIAECLTPQASISRYSSRYNSRFKEGSYEPGDDNTFKTRVKAQYLSPETTYTVNLVFKKKNPKERYIGLEYKSEGGRKCYSFLSDEIENGWMTAELYQFTSNERGAALDLEILFKIKYCDIIAVEGIEFRPIEKLEDEMFIDQNVNIQDWNQEAKTIYNDDGKKHHILPTRVAFEDQTWRDLPQIRIEEVPHESSFKFIITYEIESNVWPRQTSETTYATYLVYKQPDDEVQPRPAQVKDKNSSRETCDIYLHTPQTPVIIRGKVDKKIHNPSHRPKIKSLPKQRREMDGWMEVQIWEFQIDRTTRRIPMHLKLSSYDASLEGIVLQGIEFRPISNN